MMPTTVPGSPQHSIARLGFSLETGETEHTTAHSAGDDHGRVAGLFRLKRPHPRDARACPGGILTSRVEHPLPIPHPMIDVHGGMRAPLGPTFGEREGNVRFPTPTKALVEGERPSTYGLS